MDVAIIGGGAGGFFAAICVKENYPKANVTIFEKSNKVLSKVKVSGGGRCNVTNATTSISELCNAYPRGLKKLKKIFREFNNLDTMAWFESRGVKLTVQEDNHVFPVTQDSQTIIDCFLNACNKLGIKVILKKPVTSIIPDQNKYKLQFKNEAESPELFHKIIIATGGSPKGSGLAWLKDLGHKIEPPVPSLFTFNMPNENITELMGVVVEKTIVSIQGTKLRSQGPLLITHWGMSGPAIIVLSAFGARILNECDYTFKVQVNWVNEVNNETVKDALNEIVKANSQKQLSNYRPYQLPDRLWQYLILKSSLPPSKLWSELGKKGINKLVTLLTNDVYDVKGKTTFKEEFVTCGGVSLDSIDLTTMQSTVCKNIYFTGEVIDIDGITGGFNFQSAWTTAFIAAQLKN
ncbi:MAG: NAD(P)/FAD-dependent oxidoreductase [Saprospiraceae bacterium]|nr:NAD(P)/FAD-dependent oxidoreductase [Saprospiraceae bacterium]